MPIRSQEPLPGLPRGCRFPKPWAVLGCFPRPQAGSWKGSRAAGAHMGSQACKARTFNHLRHHAGPNKSYLLKVYTHRARHDGLGAKVLTLNMPGSYMGSGCNPGSPASHPPPRLWPGKAIKDTLNLWDPAPTWDTRKKLLAPGFGLAQLQPLQPLGE